MNTSFTKRGPGRTHKQGDGMHRNLTVKQQRAGQYGRWLREWITGKNLMALLNAAKHQFA